MPAKTYAIGLVACCSRKAKRPMPAKDLYLGASFRRPYIYVSRLCHSVWILSGKYGLVHPDDIIAPYDDFLGRKSAAERIAWADMVFQQFCDRIGSASQRVPYYIYCREPIDSIYCRGWRPLVGNWTLQFVRDGVWVHRGSGCANRLVPSNHFSPMKARNTIISRRTTNANERTDSGYSSGACPQEYQG